MKRLAVFLLIIVMATLTVLPIYAATAINPLNASINNSTKQVTVNGSISSGSGKQVTIKIIDPNEDLEYISQTTSGEDGSFSFQYKMSNTTQGTYHVYIGGQGIAEPVHTTFNYYPEDQDQSAANAALKVAGNKTTGSSFAIKISGAKNSAGVNLSGSKAVTIESNKDGQVYSGSPSFEAGNATVTIPANKVTTVATHILTVTISGVTPHPTVTVTVVAASNEGDGGHGGGSGGSGGGGGGGGGNTPPTVPPTVPPTTPPNPPASITLPDFTNIVEQAANPNNSSNPTVVALTVETIADTNNEISIVLPAGAMNVAQSNGISIIEISSASRSIAISMAPDTFGNQAMNEEIIIKVKSIDDTVIPEELKNSISKSSKIVDLKAFIGDTQITNFEKPIKVGIPYTLRPGESPELITIYNLKDDGTLENFGGRYDAASGLVFFYTGHFSKYVAAPAKPKYFKDMKGFDWAKNALYEMSAKNFINGTGIDTFSPGANLSRAEVSAILVRMLKYQANEESIPFKDLNAGKWYCKEVKAAYDNGLINGKGADRFDPDSKITRAEVAVIFGRIIEDRLGEKAGVTDLSKYSDLGNLSQIAAGYVDLISRKGIIQGSNGKFRPNDAITRAEVVMMLKRLSEIL